MFIFLLCVQDTMEGWLNGYEFFQFEYLPWQVSLSLLIVKDILPIFPGDSNVGRIFVFWKLRYIVLPHPEF